VPLWIYVSALVAITIVSRLPQLASTNLLLDGDECVLGLMAKHIAEGHGFPIFFYGQQHGLTIVEAGAAALTFLVFGPGVLELKLSMLALWALGVLVYFFACSWLFGAARSFAVALVLALLPAWAVWSMKARGGYITAFVATAALFYVLMRSEPPRARSWMATGALTAVIYFAQPFWLPGALPVLLFFLVRARRLTAWLFALSGGAGVILLARLASGWNVGDSWGLPPIGNPDLVGSLPRLLEQIYVTFTGSYYLRFSMEPGPVTALAAYVWTAVAAAALAAQIYRLLKRRYLLWSHLLFIGALLTIAADWVLIETREARYLLPLGVLVVLWAGVELSDLTDRHAIPARLARALIAGVVALGAVSLPEFARFSFMWQNPPNSLRESARLEALFDHLRARGVRRVFSMNGLLQWQLMFYSGETILARWMNEVDRYPAYIREVDRALDAGETVAIVGYVGATRGIDKMVSDPQAVVEIDGKYFVYVGPTKELLKRLAFRFEN
jgi:hypothetical protein